MSSPVSSCRLLILVEQGLEGVVLLRADTRADADHHAGGKKHLDVVVTTFCENLDAP